MLVFLQYYGKYGNGEYSVTVKYEADEHELFFRLKLDGVQVDLDSCETWRSDAQDYWFGKSFLLDSYTFGGYIPQPTQETIIATFTVNGIKTATNIIDPGTTITIDSDITPLIEKLKQNNSTLEPLGTYEFKITSGEEISGYGVIKIMKDGHNLEGGDGIINYPVFHLNNPEEGFVINGKFEATGSVSYAPSAGDVEGYILPMFCM